MTRTLDLTAIITREGDGFVALCSEIGIASQGDTVAQARSNLIEALEGYFEVASEQQIEQAIGDSSAVESYVSRVRLAVA